METTKPMKAEYAVERSLLSKNSIPESSHISANRLCVHEVWTKELTKQKVTSVIKLRSSWQKSEENDKWLCAKESHIH